MPSGIPQEQRGAGTKEQVSNRCHVPSRLQTRGDPSARSSSASGALQAIEGVSAYRATAAARKKDRGEDYAQEAWRGTGVTL